MGGGGAILAAKAILIQSMKVLYKSPNVVKAIVNNFKKIIREEMFRYSKACNILISLQRHCLCIIVRGVIKIFQYLMHKIMPTYISVFSFS